MVMMLTRKTFSLKTFYGFMGSELDSVNPIEEIMVNSHFSSGKSSAHKQNPSMH